MFKNYRLKAGLNETNLIYIASRETEELAIFNLLLHFVV